GSGLRHTLDFDDTVDDDRTDTHLDGTVDLGEALVVAVQAEPGSVDAGSERDREFPATRDINVETLLGHPPCDLGRQERLACVVDLRGASDPSELAVEGRADA